MNLDEVRQSLEEKLSTLTARVSRIQSHLRDPGSKDSQERATETENDEVLEGLDEAERREIEAIRFALDRVRNETYGVCSRCGGEIAPKRLEALPYTSVCISCAG